MTGAARRAGRGERVVCALLAAAVVMGIGLAAHQILWSRAGRVIVDDPGAPWIMADEPFSAMNRQWGRVHAPRVRFARTWRVERVPEAARLRARAFGDFSVRINGRRMAFDDAASRPWRRFQTREVARALRLGLNRIVVDVRNRRGPALLSLALETEPGGLSTAEGWTARIAEGPEGPARPAEDVRRHPAAVWLPTPARGVADHGLLLAAAGVLGAGAGIGLSRRSKRWAARAPLAAVGLAGAFWGLLLATTFREMPLSAGFDARGHLDYVTRLAGGVLPLATDGWSTYHPPLYHLLVATLAPIGELVGEGAGHVARRLPAWAAGVGTVWMSGRLAAVLHPGRPVLRAVSVAFAALLPVNVYIAGTITNEGLLAFLAAGALVSGAELVRSDRVRPGALLAVSCWLGLALLTKYTALVAAGVVGAFVLGRIAVEQSTGRWSRARDALLLAAPAMVLCGWFYARNVVVYGRLLVPNWDLPGPGRTWWSPPGFHTPAYFTGFGESLHEPFFAGFVSFWDGLYSTLWGDGLLSGAPGLRDHQVPWSLDWMAITYWVAVPVTLLVAAGLVVWIRDALRQPEPRRAAALALPLVYGAAMAFAIFQATLVLPYFGQARAPYGLSATPVLALGFARGLAALDGAMTGRLRLVVWAGLGALLALYGLVVVRAYLG